MCGGTGLGIYDDSDTSDSENDTETPQAINGDDSDEDLRVSPCHGTLVPFVFCSVIMFESHPT